MSVNRRTFLKTAAAGVGGSVLTAQPARAARPRTALDTDHAMLNDCTKCVGCRACQIRCKETHDLSRAGDDSRYDMPLDLNARSLTLIKMYREDDFFTFVKKQCLHCGDPSCVSVCPVAAFQKRDDGVVTYNKNACIGCRYCMIACPWDAPTFEYDEALPVIQKCDFCKDARLAHGLPPACADACPVGAIKYGKRGDLLKEAHERIRNNPDVYNDHVYGESELGGTSVLVLAPKEVRFEDLGYKMYGDTPPFRLQENIQHGIFKYFIPPVALYAVLGFIAYATRRGDDQTNSKDDKKG
jgi:formate dehydrogenase iron-sulfur subunit